MAEERFVRQYFDIPQWYVFAEHEVTRLHAIIRENMPSQIISCILLDCSAMCNSCIFCDPEINDVLMTCGAISRPARSC